MILTIAVDCLAAYILSIIIIVIVGVSFFYDYDNESYYEKYGARFLFHCVKCNNIYYSNNDKESSECQKCNIKNIRLKF